jgi:histidinol-phosphate aminotransferase
MKNKEELHFFLPRRVRKLLQYEAKQLPMMDLQKVGCLDMVSMVSKEASVGTTDAHQLLPDLRAQKLRNQIATQYNLTADQVCVGNDTAALLDTIFRSFLDDAEQKVLAFGPVNATLHQLIRLHGVELELKSLEPDGQLPLFDIETLSDLHRIIYIENPNQIKGTVISSFDVVDLVTQFDGIVVVDESAIDYAEEESLITLVEACPNLIILRSFSNAWGLAALQVGYALGSPMLIEVLEAIQLPFRVNTFAQEGATKALYVGDKKERIVAKVKIEKQKLLTALSTIDVVKRVIDTHLNTLLIEVASPQELVQYLYEEEGIAVLDTSAEIPSTVRITVGTELDNLRIVKALEQMHYNQSKTHHLWKMTSQFFRRASSLLGFFK